MFNLIKMKKKLLFFGALNGWGGGINLLFYWRGEGNVHRKDLKRVFRVFITQIP